MSAKVARGAEPENIRMAFPIEAVVRACGKVETGSTRLGRFEIFGHGECDTVTSSCPAAWHIKEAAAQTCSVPGSSISASSTVLKESAVCGTIGNAGAKLSISRTTTVTSGHVPQAGVISDVVTRSLKAMPHTFIT